MNPKEALTAALEHALWIEGAPQAKQLADAIEAFVEAAIAEHNVEHL